MKMPLLLVLAFSCLSCLPRPADDLKPDPHSGMDASPERIERARQALAPFKAELKSALMSAMPEGPEAAISACRMEAPRLAADRSALGVPVGRTSDRLRNPANAAQPWMLPLLEEYRAGSKRPYLTATLADGGLGYVEPIEVQALCTSCHGNALSDGLRARLDALYPTDRAQGYEEGDFRGLFWAVVPSGP